MIRQQGRRDARVRVPPVPVEANTPIISKVCRIAVEKCPGESGQKG